MNTAIRLKLEIDQYQLNVIDSSMELELKSLESSSDEWEEDVPRDWQESHIQDFGTANYEEAKNMIRAVLCQLTAEIYEKATAGGKIQVELELDKYQLIKLRDGIVGAEENLNDASSDWGEPEEIPANLQEEHLLCFGTTDHEEAMLLIQDILQQLPPAECEEEVAVDS